jgi:hypothetical protein
MKRELDARTLRVASLRMRKLVAWAKRQDAKRSDPESRYWIGAADAYNAGATALLSTARGIEKRAKGSKR